MAETKYSSTSLYRIGRRLALAVGSSLGISVETLSATKTLAADSALVQHLDPNGSNRNVVLPQGVTMAGGVQIVKNSGSSGNLVIQHNGTTTLTTLAPGEWGFFTSVAGTVWYAAGVGALSAAAAAAFTATVTTTDGVAGGDARKVGGLLSAKTSDTTLTNSTTETILGTYSVPANTLKAGTVLRCRGSVRVTADSGATTLTLRVKLGGTTVYQHASLDTAANDVFLFDAQANGGAGGVSLVSRALGTTATAANASSSVGSMSTDGRYVVAFFGSQGLYAYDMNGTLRWKRDFGDKHMRNQFGEGSTPALFGNTLVVVWDHLNGESFIAAVDKRDGHELWRVKREEIDTWATPLVLEVDGRPQVIVPAMQRLRGYDLATGEVPVRCGHQHRLNTPYQLFETVDKHYLAIGTPNDELFRRFMKTVGLEASIADPRFATIPVAAMRSKAYAATRAALVRADRATCDVSPGEPAGTDNGTTYLSVVDQEGNIISLIQSTAPSHMAENIPPWCGLELVQSTPQFTSERLMRYVPFVLPP